MSDFLNLALMPDGSPEIFKSIQGEGPKMGRVSTFVRTSECNLTCVWCDTPYTWRWHESLPHEDDTIYDKRQWQRKTPLDDVCKAIIDFNCKHLIFTGGEPLLQQRAILAIGQQLEGTLDSFEFETNGTIAPRHDLIDVTTLFVVSPKLSNSGVAQDKALKSALHRFAETGKSAFKFVIAEKSDLTEVHDFQKEYGVENEEVWLMPCGRTSQQLHQTSVAMADWVIAEGYQFSPRLHVDLFGDTPGT